MLEFDLHDGRCSRCLFEFTMEPDEKCSLLLHWIEKGESYYIKSEWLQANGEELAKEPEQHFRLECLCHDCTVEDVQKVMDGLILDGLADVKFDDKTGDFGHYITEKGIKHFKLEEKKRDADA